MDARAPVSPTTGSTGTITFSVRSSRPAAAASDAQFLADRAGVLDAGRGDEREVGLCAASARERGDVPACTIGRCPCGGRATFSGPLTRSCAPWKPLAAAAGIDQHAGRGIRRSIVLARVPQAPEHLLELLGAVVAGLVVGVGVAAVVAGRARLGAGDEVDARAAAGEQVERCRRPRDRVRVGVGRVHGRDEPDALGDPREVRSPRSGRCARADTGRGTRGRALWRASRRRTGSRAARPRPPRRRAAGWRRRRAGRRAPGYRQPEGYAPSVRTIAPTMSRVMCSTSRLPTLGRPSGCREGRRHTAAPPVTRVNGTSRNVIAIFGLSPPKRPRKGHQTALRIRFRRRVRCSRAARPAGTRTGPARRVRRG